MEEQTPIQEDMSYEVDFNEMEIIMIKQVMTMIHCNFSAGNRNI